MENVESIIKVVVPTDNVSTIKVVEEVVGAYDSKPVIDYVKSNFLPLTGGNLTGDVESNSKISGRFLDIKNSSGQRAVLLYDHTSATNVFYFPNQTGTIALRENIPNVGDGLTQYAETSSVYKDTFKIGGDISQDVYFQSTTGTKIFNFNSVDLNLFTPSSNSAPTIRLTRASSDGISAINTLSNQYLGVLNAAGYFDGEIPSSGALIFQAVEDFKGEGRGTEFHISTTPISSNNVQKVATFTESGKVGIGTRYPSEKLTVFGNISASGIIYGSALNAPHTHQSINISDSTTFGRTLLTAANVAEQRTALGLGSVALLNTLSATDISNSTTAGRTLLTAATVQAQRTALDIFVPAANLAAIQALTGNFQRIYLALDTGKIYIWSGVGSVYNEVSPNTHNRAGVGNVFTGDTAMASPSFAGAYNTAVGANALLVNTNGQQNTASGFGALASNVDGNYNSATGVNALVSNTSGLFNTANGINSLYSNSTGSSNTAVGYGALFSCIGNNNTAIGSGCLSNNSVTNSSGLGNDAQVTASNQVQLGNSATTTYAYGAVQNRSDVRDKTDVRDTVLGLDFINSLRPVDFKWDMREDYRIPPPTLPATDASEEELAAYVEARASWSEAIKLSNIQHDGTHKRTRYHHGLIAQEVKAAIESANVDFGGFQDHSISGGDDVLSIGYSELIAPLIRAVQELKAEIEVLKSR